MNIRAVREVVSVPHADTIERKVEHVANVSSCKVVLVNKDKSLADVETRAFSSGHYWSRSNSIVKPDYTEKP